MKKIKHIIKLLLEYSLMFTWGGFIYYIIECIYRGYSHWTMYCLGGLLFIVCGLINEVAPWDINLFKQMGISAIVITLLEFITGYIVNIKLGWHVWNYSNLPFNIMGQISLPFTIIWFFLSLLPIILDDVIKYALFNGKRPVYVITKNKKIKL